MPRSERPPSYRHHKARNCAAVTIHGRTHYLGLYGSRESHEKYARLISQWRIDGPKVLAPAPADANRKLTVNGLVLRFLEYAEGEYTKHGQPTGELSNLCCALKPLTALFGLSTAADFSAASLKLVREGMIDKGWARRHVNQQVSRVKRAFAWASVEGIVPPGTYHGLLALQGLKWGRSRAPESKPVTTIDVNHVRNTCKHLGRHVGAMVQVQELTGMRPQDIRNLRTCDLDRADDVWVYQPWTHKTEHHGHTRRVAIGPRAQKILQPFLKPAKPTAYVFSPKDAVAEMRALARQRRKTPMTPSQRVRNPKLKPKRSPGDQHSQNAYANAIRRAALRAGVPHWTPHQLRHNCATHVRKQFGYEAAAIVLGHKLGTVTEVYAEADFEKAKSIMREIG